MERYVIHGGERGYERLRVLARAWLPTTAALLDRIGISPGMHCVDLGCGAGDVTFALSQRVHPHGVVVGIDMDEVKLDLARGAATEQGLSNVTFRAENVYDWNQPDTYDVVYCRFLLQHLSRPLDVLRTMWTAVRAGGVLVVEDVDFEGSFCDPPDEGFDFWVTAYQDALRRAGGDPLLGRKLRRYFVEAGIPSPELTLAQRFDVDGEAKTLPHSTIELTAESIVSTGVASQSDVDAALSKLIALAADAKFLLGSPRLFQAWARRTDAPESRVARPT